jgi:hypothetical protein
MRLNHEGISVRRTAVRAQVEKAVSRNAVRVILTNFFGGSISVAEEQLSKQAAERITILTADEILAQTTARGISTTKILLGRSIVWGIRGLATVVSVGGFVTMMSSNAQAADIDPEYDMYEALNYAIKLGYTNKPTTTRLGRGASFDGLEIETWRLTDKEFDHVRALVRSMIYFSLEDRERIIKDLEEEREHSD